MLETAIFLQKEKVQRKNTESIAANEQMKGRKGRKEKKKKEETQKQNS
jgi:hypothetical protein